MKKTNPPKIKKNNSTYIINNINKIKENEKKLLFLNVILMILVIVLVSYVTVFAVGKNNIFDSLSVSRYVTHEKTVNIISSKLFLDKSLIVKDSLGIKKTPYKFKIVNKKKEKISYKVILDKDTEVIKEEKCQDEVVDLDTLKYSLDGENILSLRNNYVNGKYVLMKGEIPGLTSLEYNLYIWINNSLLKDKNKSHFHGLLVLEED